MAPQSGFTGLGGQSNGPEGFTTSTSQTSSTTQSQNTITPPPSIGGPGSTATSSSASVPTSSTVPALTSSSKGHSSEVATGAAVGGIIGALIGGLLLGFVTAFIFLRRWTQQQSRGQLKSKKKRHSEKPLALNEGSEGTGNGLKHREDAWKDHLPQPADDNSLRLRFKTLFHQVELHVENFYTSTESSAWAGTRLERELAVFDSGHLPGPLAVMMQQTRSKSVVIKHSLLYFVLARICLEARSPSFLPNECTALPSAINETKSENNKPGAREILSQWRVITAYLRPDTGADQAYINQRDRIISEAGLAFSDGFAPWAVTSQSKRTRCQNLVEIMRGAAEIGFLIFSQPSTFGYDWDTSTNVGSGRALVVTPAVVKLTDEHTVQLSKPQVIVQQTVEET